MTIQERASGVILIIQSWREFVNWYLARWLAIGIPSNGVACLVLLCTLLQPSKQPAREAAVAGS